MQLLQKKQNFFFLDINSKGSLGGRYWKTQAEIDGKSPMQTLLPYMAILGLLTPFIILGIAFSAGYIKTP